MTYRNPTADSLSTTAQAALSVIGPALPDAGEMARALATRLPDLDPQAAGATILVLADVAGEFWGQTGCAHLVQALLTIAAAGNQLYTQPPIPADTQVRGKANGTPDYAPGPANEES